MQKMIVGFSVALLLNGFISITVAAPQQDFAKKYQAILDDASPVVDKAIEQLHDSVNKKKNSPDERNLEGYVTSTEVVTFRNIPRHVEAEIAAIRKKIKTIIFMAATDIEQTGSSGKVNFQNGELDYLPKDAKAKYQRLMQAKKRNNVSVYSVNVAIKMLSSLNEKLIAAAKEEQQIDRKNKLFITQAAYVYEMADIVLEVLDNIGLNGKADIEALYQDYKNKINKRQQSIQQELRKTNQAESQGSISKTYAAQLRETYSHMQKANQTGLGAWEEVMAKVSLQENWLNNLKGMRTMIELKRNAAGLQLDTLRDIGVLRGAMKIVDNMAELVNTVGNMELLVLDDNTVRQLIFGDPRLEGSDL